MKGKLGTLLRNSNRVVHTTPSPRLREDERSIMYAENAVCLIIRHLAMVEEHCFTTNGLAPVNHPDTMRARSADDLRGSGCARGRVPRGIKDSG